jgi:hypothetical protein
MTFLVRRFFLCSAIGFLTLAATFASPTEDRLDISRIIDKAGAESIIGEKVKVPTPRNMHGGDGYYSKCNYYSASSKKALILRVYQAGSGFDAEKELDAVKASTGTGTPVAGLGDKAQAYSGPESGLPANVVMLYVIKGNTLITVGLSGLEDHDALEKSKNVAQKILAQL